MCHALIQSGKGRAMTFKKNSKISRPTPTNKKQTFPYWLVITANDSMKSQCMPSGMRGQGVCLQAFPSFPSPCPLFYSLHFSHNNNYLLPNPTETLAMLLLRALHSTLQQLALKGCCKHDKQSYYPINT